MSLAVAQQMVNTMNQTMQHMWMPGAQNTLMSAPAQIYYAMIENSQVGPLSESDLTKLINERKIDKATYMWMPGLSGWQPAEKLPSVMRMVALSPPPFEQQQ